MGHYPKTHPSTSTSPAAVLQLSPFLAQGVLVPAAGQKPPMWNSQASSATSHPLTPEGPTWPAQTLATITLRAASSLPQPCPPPAQPSPPAPSPGRSFKEGVLHHGEPEGSAPLLPKAISDHNPFQVAPLLLQSQGSPQELHYPWPRAGSVAVCTPEILNTPDTAGCCHTHGLLPYRDGPPREGHSKAPMFWSTQHPLPELQHREGHG